MDYQKITEEVRKYTQEHVKPSRYEHSVRVAEMCSKLCKHYSLDEKKGYLAGIGHDMCKDMPFDLMIETAKRDGNPIIPFEERNLALLHGRAAAVLIKEKFGVDDEEICEAIANHTSGKQGMGDISKCLFLADKIEPGRPQVTEKYLERLFKMSLNEMLCDILEENFEYLQKKGVEFYPGTLEMIEFYKK